MIEKMFNYEPNKFLERTKHVAIKSQNISLILAVALITEVSRCHLNPGKKNQVRTEKIE